MKKTQCIGLVGGLGVGAAVDYYTQLARAAGQQGAELDLVMVNADMERALVFMEAGDSDGFARYLAGAIARLEAAGADFAVIPSVTGNSCARSLVPISPLPIASIYKPVAKELARRGWKRVALLGTRFVVESGMFGYVSNAEFVLPHPAEIATIHENYIAIARAGAGTPEQLRTLTDLAQTLIARENLDAVLLAGTDLSLLFNESNTDFPHLDCAKLHIEAIARAMLD